MDADTEERPAKKTRMYDSDQDGAPTPAPPRLPAEVVSTPAISTSALRSVLKGAVFACIGRLSLIFSSCCKTKVNRWCTVFVVQAVPNYAQPWCDCLLSTCWFGDTVSPSCKASYSDIVSFHSQDIKVLIKNSNFVATCATKCCVPLQADAASAFDHRLSFHN